MSVFSGFGAWINQNIQQPLKAESKRSENVKSKPEKNTNNQEQYFDVEEVKKQDQLWRDAERKHPWYDAPPKVKVTTKDGLCHMNIELTIGLPPDGVYDLVANPSDAPFFPIDKFGRQLLENKSRKVLKKDGPRQIAEVEKAVAWDFLWWSGAIPIKLIVDENEKVHTGKYKKEKMMFMKVFEGKWKLEPISGNSFLQLCDLPWSILMKENKSRKILMKDGPREVAKLEKAVAWDFFCLSGTIPIDLIADENQKDFTAKYKKEKMMFMKVFEGSWKIEPLYVDAKRLCKYKEPRSREEYKNCSGGQGKIASKVTMDQYFQPYPLLNLPLLSWYIHGITIKTTKNLLSMLQKTSVMFRDA